MIREIKSDDWPEFCERLSQQMTGATAKLEVVEADGVRTERVADAAFQSMAFGAIDSCSDAITIRLRGGREIVYQILDPIKILLHPSGGAGDFNPLQFEGENGVTFITLHPAIHQQILEGMKTS